MNLLFRKSLPDNMAIIRTDNIMLVLCLPNLIKNAIKFSSKGDIEFGYTVDKEEGQGFS